MGGGSGKLVKFQQHTRKKPEDEKTQLNLSDILLPYHLPLGWCHVTAQFRRIMGTFGGIFGNFFFTFFPKFFGKFWSAGSSRKPIQKTSPVPLVYVPFFWIFNPFTITQKFWYREKIPSKLTKYRFFFISTELPKNFNIQYIVYKCIARMERFFKKFWNLLTVLKIGRSPVEGYQKPGDRTER